MLNKEKLKQLTDWEAVWILRKTKIKHSKIKLKQWDTKYFLKFTVEFIAQKNFVQFKVIAQTMIYLESIAT